MPLSSGGHLFSGGREQLVVVEERRQSARTIIQGAVMEWIGYFLCRLWIISNPPVSSAIAAPPDAGSISGTAMTPARQLTDAPIINNANPSIFCMLRALLSITGVPCLRQDQCQLQ
jgi:hypothetical protein